MATSVETSDRQFLDLLQQRGPLSVAQLGRETGVTATAVRQRLTRLMSQQLIERVVVRPTDGVGHAAERGRPSHRYRVTEKARRQAGSNFADLAVALWEEIRAVEDPAIRRGLLQRLANRLATIYAGKVQGNTLDQRLESLQNLFSDRNVTMEIDRSGALPVLKAHSCPYPDLAEHDRGVCSLEKQLFGELLGQSVRLTECRLDGDTCCSFAAH